MAKVSLERLRVDVRQLAGNETGNENTALTDKLEANRRVNEACALFHNMMARMQRHEWVLTQVVDFEFTLNTTRLIYPLPEDFFVLSGHPRVSDGNRQYRLLDWERTDRDILEEADELPYLYGYEYRINGANFHILPNPRDTYTVFVSYVPEFRDLVKDDDFITLPTGWHKWITLTAAKDLLNKEKLDTSHLDIMFAKWDFEIQSMIGKRGTKHLRVVDSRRDGRRWPRLGRLAEG